MRRRVVLDTETTGLKPEDGHRIVEIGAVELIDGVKTGRVYHQYINPERHIPEEVVTIHGIDDEKVKNEPTFRQVADDFLKFIAGSELVIHKADFDIKFLNSELNTFHPGRVWDHVVNAICTLKLDKRLYANERSHTLDSICKRIGVDNSHRVLHGALMDADILADVFIKINEIHSAEDIEADLEQTNWVRPTIKRFSIALPTVKVSAEEENAHTAFLAALEKKEKVTPVFGRSQAKITM